MLLLRRDLAEETRSTTTFGCIHECKIAAIVHSLSGFVTSGRIVWRRTEIGDERFWNRGLVPSRSAYRKNSIRFLIESEGGSTDG